MGKLLVLDEHKRRGRTVSFDRRELSLLLSVYSRRVMSGEWRDYAIDHQTDLAVFSIFRHSHDRPLFTIAKRLDRYGGDYVVYFGRQKIARSRSLSEVLGVLERRPSLVT